jgi:hypothetical protein
MRQGQQNRRGRGRGRKPQNPLARNYESNGPDVKIRGTATHIAEKYMSLARDALASGDLVTAESYLQHAEHYNRIIMAAQSQMSPQPGQHQPEGPNGGGYRQPRYNAESANAEAANADSATADSVNADSANAESANEDGGEPGAKPRAARGDRRRGGNGREGAAESNGSDRPATRQPDDSASDPVT